MYIYCNVDIENINKEREDNLSKYELKMQTIFQYEVQEIEEKGLIEKESQKCKDIYFLRAQNNRRKIKLIKNVKKF